VDESRDDAFFDEDRLAYEDTLVELIGDLSARAPGANGVIRGVDEYRLVRVLETIRAELGREAFCQLREFLESWLESELDERQIGLRVAVLRVLEHVEAEETLGRCRRPVKVEMELDSIADGNLTTIRAYVTRTGAPIDEVSVSMDAPSRFKRVIQIEAPEEPAKPLLASRTRVFSFDVELHGKGAPVLGATVRLKCNRGARGPSCACCYRGAFRWTIRADDQAKPVIWNVEVLKNESSVVELNFPRDLELGASQAASAGGDAIALGSQTSPGRFGLPLSLDIPAILDRASELFGKTRECQEGQTRVRGGHFRVGSDGASTDLGTGGSDSHRVLFVLFDHILHLGHSEKNHLVARPGALNEPKEHWRDVSRKHATLTWTPDNDAVRLSDGCAHRESGELQWRTSTNGTGLVREGTIHPKLGGGDRGLSPGEEESYRLEDGDRVVLPFETSDIPFPYKLDVAMYTLGYTRTGDAGKLAIVISPPDEIHQSIQPRSPYSYVWLPAATHEALVGAGPGVVVRIPSMRVDHAFRLLRDRDGHLFVCCCEGADVTLRGRSRRRRHFESVQLAPHRWYCLGDRDELRCGDAVLTFRRHAASDKARVPSLPGCYASRTEPGSFDTKGFGPLLLPLMVRDRV